MIHLARFLERSVTGVNGPGERAVVWVQGCPFRCPGCFNPDFLEFGGHHEHVHTVSARQLADMVLEEHARRPLDGVTFSGGEPFAQADGLAPVADMLRAQSLSVVVFTGYTHGQLTSKGSPAMRGLLAQTDLLVAGPFVPGRRMERPDLRGSSNQEVLYLTDRIPRSGVPGPQVELQVAFDGCVHMTGFPSPKLRDALRERFEAEVAAGQGVHG